MKKGFVLILALIFVLGLAGSAFAAANPFVDVPAKHWAYDAISKLAKDGIVDGYGDGTFRGDRTMTRYEMAQVVAKAMAYQGKINAEQKAMIDKLAVEFSTELQNLGVRVSNVESKLNKMPKFNGEVRLQYVGYSTSALTLNGVQYTPDQVNNATVGTPTWANNAGKVQYINQTAGTGNTSNTNFSYARLRLYLTGNINDNWTYNARLAAYSNAKYGYLNATPSNNSLGTQVNSNNAVMFDYGYLKGSYNNWKLYLGKFADTLPFAATAGKDDGGFGINQAAGMLNDSWLTGARIAYNADKLKVNVFYGSDINRAGWTTDSNSNPILVNIGASPNSVANNGFADSKTFGADIGYALSDKFNVYYSWFQQSVKGADQAFNFVNVNGTNLDTNVVRNISYNQFGLDYKFSPRFLFSGFVGGSNATVDNKAWTARVDYGSESFKADSTKKGSWSVYAFWQDLQRFSAWAPTYDNWNVYGLGGRGMTLGVNWVFIPNTMFNVEYSYLNNSSSTTPWSPTANQKKIKVTLDYFF